MRGLDPRIHLLAKKMDRRIKSGDDEENPKHHPPVFSDAGRGRVRRPPTPWVSFDLCFVPRPRDETFPAATKPESGTDENTRKDGGTISATLNVAA